MDSLISLRHDLQPYIVKLNKPNRLSTTAMSIEGSDVFVSPLTGKPFTPIGTWSKKGLATVDAPSITEVLYDGIATSPTGHRWRNELFADSHVKAMTVD